MLIKIFLSLFSCIIVLKVVFSIKNIFQTKKNLENVRVPKAISPNEKVVNMILLIPILREQKVIEKTMEYFKSLSIANINLHIVIAGTIREKIEKNKLQGNKTTKEVVEHWIKNYKISSNYKASLHYYFFEAEDEVGDRATQLNNGVRGFVEENKIPIDIIGVYDADSLPDSNTLIEVINNFQDEETAACQQPVHFVDAANAMAINKENPILIANALYQTTWTMIRELPRWIQYYNHRKSKPDTVFKRNIYLIGHGEFLKYDIYKDFKFPEFDVTDGIQLGYRLSMSNKTIKPLYKFCSDDVPRKTKQLVSQHKRWFGGCMRLSRSYEWSKNYSGFKALLQMLDGYWSQLCWAWASLVSIAALLVSIADGIKTGSYVFPLIEISGILTYCYLIPILAHRITPVKIKVRFMDWLCLPLAIALKGIGPNMFFIESMVIKLKGIGKVNYTKVER